MSSSTLSVDQYVAVLGDDYLTSYLMDGGSTVKVLVGTSEARIAAEASIRAKAKDCKLTFVTLNARETRIQNIHDVFFAIARQLNWNALTSKFLRKLLFPRFELSDNLTVEGIARKNGMERWIVHRALDELIQERILRRNGFSGEFKRAIYNLIDARLSPTSPLATMVPNVIAWFCGKLDRITLLKPAMLHRRIGKQNGRQLLESLSRWLRDCGSPGLVVCVDISTVTLAAREQTGQHYSRLAAVDCFELMRQFIDSVDLIEGLALIFLADESFVDDERRGFSIYPALKMRLTDDVHDSQRVNPFAPMVRIAGNA